MMAKQENFDFETDKKFNLDLSFFKNLTAKQKETILMIAIAVVAVIVIVIIGVIVLTGGNGNGNGNNGGNGGITGDVSGDDAGTEDGGENGGSAGDENLGPVKKMYVSSPPDKTTFKVGDVADFSGLKIAVDRGAEGTKYLLYEENKNMFTLSGFDSSVPAEQQVITIAYNGMTTTFTITIEAVAVQAPKLVSIHLGTYPKQIFSVDDKFSYSDGVLVCTYEDGSTKEFPLTLEYMYGLENIVDYTGEHILVPGEHVIEIEYTENGVSVQTEYTITVN